MRCPICDGDTKYHRIAKSGRIDYRCIKCFKIVNCFTDTKLNYSKLDNDTIQSMRILLETRMSVALVAHRLNVSRPTVYRYKAIWRL
jgi:transposase-like protein